MRKVAWLNPEIVGGALGLWREQRKMPEVQGVVPGRRGDFTAGRCRACPVLKYAGQPPDLLVPEINRAGKAASRRVQR